MNVLPGTISDAQISNELGLVSVAVGDTHGKVLLLADGQGPARIGGEVELWLQGSAVALGGTKEKGNMAISISQGDSAALGARTNEIRPSYL